MARTVSKISNLTQAANKTSETSIKYLVDWRSKRTNIRDRTQEEEQVAEHGKRSRL